MNKKHVCIFTLSLLLSSNILLCDKKGDDCNAEDSYCECIHPGEAAAKEIYRPCVPRPRPTRRPVSRWVYSPDGKFRISKRTVRSGNYGDRFLEVEQVGKTRKLFKFKSAKSFSFSTDSNYILVERSEYNDDLCMTNDFIEIFDLHNRKRVFYMPFFKKFYTSRKRRWKSVNLSERMNLAFKGEIFKSIEWDIEGVFVTIPVNFHNVRSVFASDYSLGLSVYFKDGVIKIYLPNKDFAGLYETFTFSAPQIVDSSDYVQLLQLSGDLGPIEPCGGHGCGYCPNCCSYLEDDSQE